MPCYNNGEKVIVYTTYPKGCETSEPSAFTLPLGSGSIVYTGAALPNSGIEYADTLTVALQKLDNKLDPEEIVNAVISAIEGNETLRAALCAALNC